MKILIKNTIVILILFAAFYPLSVSAQDEMPKTVMVIGHMDKILGSSVKISDSMCVDTSFLNAVYESTFLWGRNKIRDTFYTRLSIGDNFSMFMREKGNYGIVAREANEHDDVSRIDPLSGLIVETKHDRMKLPECTMTFDLYLWILKDKANGNLKFVVSDFYYSSVNPASMPSDGLANIYRESIPVIEWDITGDTAEVSGYGCIRAECDFRGRHWTVWFAPEIAVNEGPWKLHGLPGLVLKAECDGGYYTFECISLDNGALPICDYRYVNEREMKYRRYMKYEKHCHDSPMSYIGDCLLPAMRDDLIRSGGWHIPYYPMEYLPGKNNSGKRAK